jgi:hypothetical protein
MNPLEWKREHQIALACAAAIGGVAGLIFGLARTNAYDYSTWGKLWCEREYSCIYLLNGYWLKVIFWTALGGSIGAALIYIRQLLRS